MHDHPERAPRNGLDAITRILLAVALGTAASVAIAVLIAAVVLVTANPVILGISAIIALAAVGCVVGQLSRWVQP